MYFCIESIVDETGLDEPKVDETAVDETVVDEPGPHRQREGPTSSPVSPLRTVSETVCGRRLRPVIRHALQFQVSR